MKTIAAALIAAVTGLSAATMPAWAQFPEKPIKIVVPFSAGGGSDGLARAVQAAIEKHDILPVPVVVVNADGAAGTVGTRQVLQAEPDGYTILQIHQEMFAASAIGRVEYKPSDLEPIVQASQSCTFLAVPKDSQFNSLKDLLDYSKAHPGKLKQADDIGSATHFPSAQLMSQAGTQWTIVPTGGTSKRFAALKGGFADMALMSAPWLTRGKDDLKPLAAFGSQRFAEAPDLPTAQELGYDVDACLKRRYWAPKGTPEDRIKMLADAIAAAVETEEVRGYLDNNGEQPTVLEGAALKEAIQKDYQSYVDVVDVVKKTSGR
ncbi:tripartite tricarboxylate transporter substrate binding protein [Aurantimonas sp. VKM B-3413]|uniref:tripartite tricarboxylate transporter substrate binding protein n=1 Tax=Aurantimonas sp. VKM B-3413 TaxID=2779401 RepID=UPI001E356F71|nr:tripartite tricarboxylate transporter substrate binding protein [Aurantimonas sp. VKM B-3413]MCB8840538.1 tripartite tricarboxylate transporter substrate binding protein [Aurantimonas sp. VKM B-3413]